MNEHFNNIILKATGASSLKKMDNIQELWSGYGSIVRYGLEDARMPTVVVKHVRMPNAANHPRGWNSDLSHQRKVKSYQVETAWYQEWSKNCTDDCYVPKCLACETDGDEVLMVLEDLDAVGYDQRRRSVSLSEINMCLSWLAHFHATFMNETPTNLWKAGTYWHLDTRPDELAVLDDQPLKDAAATIDQLLSNSPFQTFVHGDAKLANFCFSKDGERVAAVDFQYVGGGCGMKDVAYFVGSCLHEKESSKFESTLLAYYFHMLKMALEANKKNIDVDALEKDWRALYPVAWTDFHRFIKGWSPGHWKVNTYSERVARQTIESL